MTKQIKISELFKQVHWHFEIFAYEKKGENNQLLGSTEITISEAQTEEEAMAIAKDKIKRPHYFLRKAWQCKQCYVQDEMLNHFRKHNNG